MKKGKRGYKLEDTMDDVENEFEDSKKNLENIQSTKNNMDFHMMKRNTVVLQNLKCLDINKIVNMVVDNNKKVPGGKFMGGTNQIDEIYEERSDNEESESGSRKSSTSTKIRRTLTNINDIDDLKNMIKDLKIKNDELEKSLHDTNYKLIKKESEIEEKSITAEKNKNKRAKLQILKTKNEKILRDKNNEINDLKKKLQEKEGKTNTKKEEEKNIENNTKLNNEINDLKKQMKGKENEIEELKKI